MNHNQAAGEMIDGRRASEIEIGRAQVHATLALIDMLRAVLAEPTGVNQAADQTPPTSR